MILEGPHAQITIGEITISVYTTPGHKGRIEKRHGKLAREAADMRPPGSPNPCIIPLDPETKDEGGPFVYAHVLEDPDAIKRRERNIAARYFG